MIDSLHTDTYYRGYRLATLPDGRCRVYHGTDLLGTYHSKVRAMHNVDGWVEKEVK